MILVRRISHCQPGRRDETVKLIKEFYDALQKHAGVDLKPMILTGSIGPSDTIIETNTQVETIAQFEELLAKNNDMPEMEAYQKKMAELLVPGTGRFEIYRIQS